MWITMAEKIEMTVSQSRQCRLYRRSRKSGSVGTFDRKYSGAKNSDNRMRTKPAIHSKLPNTMPYL